MGTLVGEECKIVYSVKKVIQVLHPQHITNVHPRLLCSKGPWVVLHGEHLGMVVSHIGWLREAIGNSDNNIVAQCKVIHGMPGVERPLEFWSEDLAMIAAQKKALMSALYLLELFLPYILSFITYCYKFVSCLTHHCIHSKLPLFLVHGVSN